MYLHLLGKAIWDTGFGVDDLVHEWLSQAGVVQLIMTPAQSIRGDYWILVFLYYAALTIS